MRIKICGVRTAEAGRWVAAAGADYAGLNFVSWSKRRVSEEEARRIVDVLGGRVVPVGVFMDQEPDEVAAVAERLGLEWIQLHGKETPEQCARLAARFRVIKAVAVGAGFAAGDLLPYVGAGAAAFLFDGPRPGSGEAFHWEKIRGASDLPAFVAGGLHAENVADAVGLLAPFGVDTASGVEIDGHQDRARIEAFVRAVRALGEACPR